MVPIRGIRSVRGGGPRHTRRVGIRGRRNDVLGSPPRSGDLETSMIQPVWLGDGLWSVGEGARSPTLNGNGPKPGAVAEWVAG